jgi:hypothetical protein
MSERCGIRCFIPGTFSATAPRSRASDLGAGCRSQQIDSTVDMDTVLDLIYEPMIFLLMLGHAVLNTKEAAGIVAATFRGLGAKS